MLSKKKKDKIIYKQRSIKYDSIPIFNIMFCSSISALLLLSIITINPTISTNGNSSNNIAFALDSSNKEVSTNISNNSSSFNDSSNRTDSTNIANKANTVNIEGSANNANNIDTANRSSSDSSINSNNADSSINTVNMASNSDSGIAPLADLTSDGVTLVWNSSDDPIQSTYGDSSTVLYRYNRFNVTANNIKQYQILANVVDNVNGSNGNKLIGYTSTDSTTQNGSSIDAITNTNGIVGKDLASTTTSQWGYAIADGEVTNEASLANLTYKAVPAASSSTSGKTEAVTSLNNRAFTIAFAANIADDKPAGSYRTNVEVSVVVEPKELTIADITYMQDITPEICNATPYADTAGNNQFTLRDKRVTSSSEPGYQYTVAHLKNGNNEDAGCWMTQNLAIINKTISSVDSDMVSDVFNITGSNIYGFNEGDKESRAVYYESEYGGYYNWYTTTAGTGPSAAASNVGTAIEAPSSICPKGWKLPSDKDNNGSYSSLLNGLSASSDAQIIASPYHFTRGGHIFNSERVNAAGGYYWSAIGKKMSYGTLLADSLYFYSGQVAPTGERNGCFGLSVRCVAR